MGNTPETIIRQPIGKILSYLGRNCLNLLNTRLNYLDIERNFFALLLIEQGDCMITQNELARQLETDKVSIVRIIDYLAEKGYVNRVRSATDKRKYCLNLTQKAIEVLPGIKKAMRDVTDTVFEGLSEDQKATFYSTLDAIKSNLKKANATAFK